WDLGPEGGPYDSASGVLRVQEYVDDARPVDTSDTATPPDTDPPDTDVVDLDCDVVYGLSGTTTAACPGCRVTLAITFVLGPGDPSGCGDPDLPDTSQVLTFGYVPAEEDIVYDYGDLGLWTPWWPAKKVADTVRWDASYTKGVALEDTAMEN